MRMPDSYTTVLEYGKFEYEDRKSVFIGEALPVSCEAEAVSFIESCKKRYPDAKHHVYAYVLRENSTMRFTDDREPQGTAGMPVLDTIRKKSCTDVVIVVTRYFGGTLLGTGGLVHAYTAAAVGALESAKIITYDVYAQVEIRVGYSDYQRLGNLFSDTDFRVADTDYSDDIFIKGSIKSTAFDGFCDKLTELTAGRVKAEKLGEKYEF